MEKKKAVSNSTVLILLSKIGRLDLVKNMFSTILIPTKIKDEILSKESSEVLLIRKQLNEFIKEVTVKKVKKLSLEEGESEAISLALQEKAKTFLSDDKKARKFAKAFNLETIGIIGILLWNLKHKKLNKDECTNLLEKLIEEGYYISTKLFAEVLDLIKTG